MLQMSNRQLYRYEVKKACIILMKNFVTKFHSIKHCI